MEFCEELEKDVPKGWEVKMVGEIVTCNTSNLTPQDKFETIEYLDTSSITNNEIKEIQTLHLLNDDVPSRAKRKVKHNDIIFSTVRPNLKHFGILKKPKHNMIVSTGFAVLTSTYPNVFGELIYLIITNEKNLESLQAIAEMSVSTYPGITPDDILNIKFILPTKDVLLKAAEVFISLFELADSIKKESIRLFDIQNLILSKMASEG
jgi:type I restriction enzyme S subunit